MSATAIVVAAGRGLRMRRDTPKTFLPLAGRSLFLYSLRTLAQVPAVSSLVLVVGDQWQAAAEAALGEDPDLKDRGVQVAVGGRERQDSVAAGLAQIAGAGVVVIHDAARPFATQELFARCIATASEHGAAIAALPASDTVKLASTDAIIRETIDRSSVWLAQTPQAFELELLRRAYALAARDGFTGTDEAALVERLGAQVRLVVGEEANRKLTTPEDLLWAEWYVQRARAD